MIVRTKRPKMTAGRAVIIKILSAYRENDYLLSKIEAQKLGYFAHIANDNILPRLNYSKNRYGPYSDVLNHALLIMNGHFITGFGDNDKSEAQISVPEDAIQEADAFLENEHQAFETFKRIEELIDGFETPYGMELLSTVHWVAKNDVTSLTIENVVKGIYEWEPNKPAWGERKKALMQEAHIRIALDRLKNNGWIQ